VTAKHMDQVSLSLFSRVSILRTLQ
jgi:hypothetical protein